MRDSPRRRVRCALRSLFLTCICPLALAASLSSCSADLPAERDSRQAQGGAPGAPYSIVFVIHGDGDYTYHDTSGHEYTADEEALAGAKRIAQRNPLAEVFIFHQIPRKHLLFFFPVRDGEFYYYRNGRLIADELYWRDQDRPPLDPEVRLYRRFRANNQPGTVRLFLYCGHEIPEAGGAGYDASSPDRTFTVGDLADGLKGFAGDSARFDLMILSTCFGSSPYTIDALGAFARYIIASPDNLHLSYFDLHALERLDPGLRDGDVHAFAQRFAHQSFDRLTGEIQTAVSVAVYDVDRVQEFLHRVRKVYDRTLTALKVGTPFSMATTERCDCADIPAYAMPAMIDGVEVLYRPARFGRSKNKQNHSGWECWREGGPQAGAGEAGRGLPDTTFTSGSLTIMSWKSPAMTVVRVADTLVFLYDPHNGTPADSVARRNNLRSLINGSFFSGVRGDAVHAGLLALYGRLVSPGIADRQLTHIVRINSTAHTVDFLPEQSFVPSGDPQVVEFQTGPLVIDGGNVREDLIRSSINGLTGHTRTLLATVNRQQCFFVTVTEKVALNDLAASLKGLSVFQGGRLDVMNLDGGSSVALYLRDAPGWNYNAGDRLPILIGFH